MLAWGVCLSMRLETQIETASRRLLEVEKELETTKETDDRAPLLESWGAELLIDLDAKIKKARV